VVVALTGNVGGAPVVTADATIGTADAPAGGGTDTDTAADVAAALTGAVGVTGTGTVEEVTATRGATSSTASATVSDVSLAVLGTAALATGDVTASATCPQAGALTADTTLAGLTLFGDAVTLDANTPAVTGAAAVTVPGLTGAMLTVALTRVETVVEPVATAIAVRATLTLTGTAAGLPVTVPLGTVTIASATGQHVRPDRVERVVRAVEVGGHRADPAHAVLAARGLHVQDAGDLRDRVRVVGRLQRAGQQRVLADRLGRVLRVDAGRAEAQQPLHAVLERGVEHVELHPQVVGQEVHRLGRVGEDPADPGGGQHDRARPLPGEEGERLGPFAQVELVPPAADEVGEPGGGEVPPDRRSDEPAVSCDVRPGMPVNRLPAPLDHGERLYDYAAPRLGPGQTAVQLDPGLRRPLTGRYSTVTDLARLRGLSTS
jgi:hypothetical protein